MADGRWVILRPLAVNGNYNNIRDRNRLNVNGNYNGNNAAQMALIYILG